MDLSDVRVNIDRVDQEIRHLFIERMGLSEEVISVKLKTMDKIYKPDREIEIIQKNSEGMAPEILSEYQAFLKKTMDVSRQYQYRRMLAEQKDRFVLEDCPEVLPEHNRCKVKLSCENQSLGIASVLSIVADYGVKVCDIASVQGDNGPKMYLMELKGNVNMPKIRSLCFHLSEETEAFQIVESYFCEDENA